MISLLHPTRGRAEKSYWATRNWITRANGDCELIVSIDEDDPEYSNYMRLYSSLPNTTVIVNANRSAIDAVNNAAKIAQGNIFIVVSDDSEPCGNWAQRINEASTGRKDFVIRVNDGIQKWIITLPIFDREYYNRFGYVYYPEYRHMFCDTEFTHIADLTNKIINRQDLHFPHNHYSVRKSEKDHINEKCDNTWDQGKAVYLRRVREKFGLGEHINIFAISHQSHINWLRQAL